MAESHARKLICLKMLPILTVCAALASPLPAQTNPPAPPSAPTKAFTYDVVSIKPHKDNGNYSHWGAPTQDGYEAHSVRVFDLIFSAYELKSSGQLVGLLEWAYGYEETFDIDAKVDDDALSDYQRLSDRERWAQAALMLRPMLADRFKLKVHHETRMLPVYALVVAKGGFKLKELDPSENFGGPGGMMTSRGQIFTRGPLGGRFVDGLSDAVGCIVVNKTGITGNYDIELKWMPDDQAAGASDPSIFTALKEQLGLKLQPTRAPVEILVVDHVERPSPN